MFDNNPYNPWDTTPAGSGWHNPTVNSVPQYPNTNVLRVTSLDEAIMKTNARNSEMVYFNQSKDEFYNVRVDMYGNKTWQTFPYSIPNTGNNIPVSRADFDAFVARFEALEAKFKEVGNEQPNGQSTV